MKPWVSQSATEGTWLLRKCKVARATHSRKCQVVVHSSITSSPSCTTTRYNYCIFTMCKSLCVLLRNMSERCVWEWNKWRQSKIINSVKMIQTENLFSFQISTRVGASGHRVPTIFHNYGRTPGVYNSVLKSMDKFYWNLETTHPQSHFNRSPLLKPLIQNRNYIYV